MNTIYIATSLASIILCSPTFAQFRLQPQPEQVPPEAWRSMDTHRQIDPRILRLQQEQAESQKRAQLLKAKKIEYSNLLWQRVNQNREWRARIGYSQVGITAAVADAAHYMALRDVEGQTIASRWLSAQISGIEELLRQQQNPNFIAAAHDTIVTASALAGRSSQMQSPQGVGQAASMNKASDSMSTATIYHYEVLRYLTQ